MQPEHPSHAQQSERNISYVKTPQSSAFIAQRLGATRCAGHTPLGAAGGGDKRVACEAMRKCTTVSGAHKARKQHMCASNKLE